MEMVAVIMILAVISILVIPSILNSVRDKKEELSDAMRQIIMDAGSMYYSEDRKNYPKVEGNVYCVTFQTLIEEELLDSPLIDVTTKSEINVNQYVKASVFSNTFHYEIADTCTPINNEEN